MKKTSAPKKGEKVTQDSQHLSTKTAKPSDSLRAGGTHLIPRHQTQLGDAQIQLRERFLYLIELWAADKYRYEWLENHTGIPAARWQNVLLEKQFPTLEMLIAICKYCEPYSYWLMTGHKWEIQDTGTSKYLTSPSDEDMDKFNNDREWIKERRKINLAAKKALPTKP